jgi:chitinase
MAVYWGQNGAAGADRSKWERSLADTCREAKHYDLLVLAFATSFVRTRNAGGLPELNFAYHCEEPVDEANPFLLRCPEIEEGIAVCQSLGKKVLLSLGGAAGSYGFASDAEGEAFASTVWDLFLGGDSDKRPFGAAVLDGIDLDIEGGTQTGYTAFVRALRGTMTEHTERRWLITAAPQCPFPDAFLGPSPGLALAEVPNAFDYLFVQFYNNYCSYNSPSHFAEAFAGWSKLAESGGPKLFVGLPSSAAAAPAGGYVERTKLPELVATARKSPAFAGVMLWDAGNDQNSGAPTYGQSVDAALVGP